MANLRDFKPVGWRTALLASLLLLFLDFVWIGTMTPVYKAMVKQVQGGPSMRLRMGYAAVSYAMLIALLVLFALPLSRIWLGYPFLLGWLTYGVYNFTNGATFVGYPLGTALMDTAWGGIVLGLTCWLVQVFHISD